MNSEKQSRIRIIANVAGVRLLDVVFRAIRGYRDARWSANGRMPG